MAKRDFKDAMLPSDMTELAAQLDVAECAEIWIGAVRGYAIEQLKKQVPIPGWGLAPTRPHRVWKDVAALERIVMTLGLKKTEVYTQEILSPAQMEKFAKRKGLSWDKQFAPLVDRVSSGVKLQRTDANSVSEFPEC